MKMWQLKWTIPGLDATMRTACKDKGYQLLCARRMRAMGWEVSIKQVDSREVDARQIVRVRSARWRFGRAVRRGQARELARVRAIEATR